MKFHFPAIKVFWLFLFSLFILSACVSKKKYTDVQNQNEALELRIEQLTADEDGDGVSDYFDREPGTPEGVRVDGSGQSLDSDGDGIPDYMDEEPNTPRGAQVSENGKAIDSDGDGVPDVQDLSPNTPKGAYVDNNGRPILAGSSGGGIKPPKAVPEVQPISRVVHDTVQDKEAFLLNSTGRLFISCPAEMKEETEYIVRISIADILNNPQAKQHFLSKINEVQEDLGEEPFTEQDLRDEKINLSDYMSVDIEPNDKFAVSLLNKPLVKQILPTENPEWRWKVKPLSGWGGQDAYLTIVVKTLDDATHLISQSEERFKVKINFKTSYIQDLWLALKADPKWLFTAILIPIVTFFAGIWKERRKAKKSNP
ncbi:thrombospondin type 3 repeat-containing protein [Croceimicrobium hydrocarbonivorans]|uniref:Thrombospondin type 3 repeat-containing protein n=1 Tax=Croceimicrobium hydrocarbonivorans TaxID=2761580 RepID=A0A7H0VHN9_9FLAO|nr:thrombospondin type 3 repeat-containing protein [Croceimicrobium hydrocarbonivorans]QNR25237.1 thrombospondin type 3 repeat-containing protein [Croceimicrobium hydrocarbonivorans]